MILLLIKRNGSRVGNRKNEKEESYRDHPARGRKPLLGQRRRWKHHFQNRYSLMRNKNSPRTLLSGRCIKGGSSKLVFCGICFRPCLPLIGGPPSESRNAGDRKVSEHCNRPTKGKGKLLTIGMNTQSLQAMSQQSCVR